MKKDNKRKNLLIIYAIVVVVLLVTIMFIIPDSFFLKKYEDIVIPVSPEKEPKKFVPYEEQQKRINNNHYSYEYLLLDSMGTKTYRYKCKGTKDGKLESGTCKEPVEQSYTEKTKKEVFNKIDTNYLDPTYILTKLKDIKPEIKKFQTRREYKYVTKIQDVNTDITIYADYENINKIEISSAYMTYVLKFSDIHY